MTSESGLPPIPPDARSGCPREINGRLQAPDPIVNGPKVSKAANRQILGNSSKISKAEFQTGMWEFDPFQGSQPVLRLACVCNLRLKGPEIRAFRAFDLVYRLPHSQSPGRNSGKSPAHSREIPVLWRLSAETGSITTAARPWHSAFAKSPLPSAQIWETLVETATR